MDLVRSSTDVAVLTDQIYFDGCYPGADSSTTSAPTSVTNVVATATIPYDPYTYYSAKGVPTHGINTTPLGDNISSGMSSGTKIGITVGVLAAALLAVLAAMALLYRRRRNNESNNSSPRSKARRYADGRWLNEDRNSAELKEIQQTQA